MARMNPQAFVESSLLFRLFAFVQTLWENSLLGRGLGAAARLAGRIFAGSFPGKVWYSDWPAPRHAEQSLVAGALRRVNGIWRQLGGAVGPSVRRAYESSMLVRFAHRVEPFLKSSLLVQGIGGYANDVALAPDEAGRRPVSPITFALGALLGFLPLIPSNAAGLPSPTVLMILGIWGLAAVWFAQKLATGDSRWRASSGFLPLAFLLMVAGAATVQSVAFSASLLNLVIWLTAGLVFWMAVNLVRNSRDAAALLGPILAGASLMTVWAVYQVFFPPVIEENWVDPTTSGQIVRVFASMGNPNYLAEYMALYLPLAGALWLQQPRRRLELAVPVGLMALALLLTYSRGGWLALIIAVVVFVLLRLPRLSLLFVLGALAAPLVAPESIVRRFVSAFTLEDTSNQYRVNLWGGVVDMLREVWALGAGLGAEAFAAVYQEFMPAGARAAHAHNTYLQVTAEMGILGLVAVLWTLLAIIRRTFVVGVNQRQPAMVAAVPAALIGLLFHGLVEHIWYNPKLLFAFWAVAGLGIGLALGDREDATE